MKLISWNVNGLRAVVGKGFVDIFNALDADVFCLQETKLQAGQIELDLPGYEQYWNYAERKGYSGTAVFTRIKPLNVTYGMGIEAHDTEGRMITLEYCSTYVSELIYSLVSPHFLWFGYRCMYSLSISGNLCIRFLHSFLLLCYLYCRICC